jgi:dinuclear metal center YbgI/SA1388 family protein
MAKRSAPKRRLPTIADLLKVLHTAAPPHLAESWDNVGLQVGDPGEPLGKVLVALEVTREVLAEARKVRAKTILTHHPLIFRPVKAITPATPSGALLLDLARAGLSLVTAHTNLDSVAWGTNGELADRLGLQTAGRQFLRPATPKTDLLKYVVYVPESHLQPVVEAVARAGAGIIGNYSHCTFRTKGTGTYKPLEGAAPYAGSIGELEQAEEFRVECLCPKARLAALLSEIRAVHPYEEIAWDAIPLANPSEAPAGLGLLGMLPAPLTVEALAKKARTALGADSIGIVGDGARSVERIGIFTGAGGEIIRTFRHGEMDLLVTGEMTHHDCMDARHLGIPVLLVGHWASEVIVNERLAGTMAGALADAGFDAVSFAVSKAEQSPVRRI